MATLEMLYMVCDRCGNPLQSLDTSKPWVFGPVDYYDATLATNHRELREMYKARGWRCTSLEDVCADCVRKESE